MKTTPFAFVAIAASLATPAPVQTEEARPVAQTERHRRSHRPTDSTTFLDDASGAKSQAEQVEGQ